MKYRKSSILVLGLVLTIGLMAVAVNAGHIYCTMDLIKLPLGPPHPEWGPNTWSGTISGDIDGNIYFYKTGGKRVGQASHFEEVWLITDSEYNMLLMGTDHGVVSIQSDSYRMSGVITDAAPQYASLIGRNVYMGGDIIWETPPLAPGIFRVN